MHSKLPLSPPFPPIPRDHRHQAFRRIVCCAQNSPPSENKFGFNLLGQPLGDSRWRLNDMDGSALQETLNTWVSRTQNFFTEVTSPLVKNVNDKKPTIRNSFVMDEIDEFFMSEQTIDSRTPGGNFSLAAVVSIEQFSRMNGLTGKKMQRIFKALVPESVYNDARNLVEYCCFRFLSRDSSEIHPSLKEPAFQRLIFVTMLAWEHPYSSNNDTRDDMSEKASLQRRLVGEKAFVRIAPAISGLADWSTVQNLYKALAGAQEGISFSTWSSYIYELLKVYEGRKSYRVEESLQISGERILCSVLAGRGLF